MKIRLLNLWDNFRESFWFAPALLSTLAIPAALILLQLTTPQWMRAWILRGLFTMQRQLGRFCHQSPEW